MINLYLISRSIYRIVCGYSRKKGWLLTLLLLYAGWAQAQFTIKETFCDTAVNPANPIVTGGIAKLTAKAGIDPHGSGYLRLSEATLSQVAFAYIDKSFPSSLGVVLEFDFVMWGAAGNGPGDGISMWLFDGSISGSNFRIGPYGAPLAYYASCEPDRNFYLNGGKVVCAMDYSGSFDYFSKNAGACPFPLNVPDAIVIGGESSHSSHIATVGTVGLRYTGGSPSRPTESEYYRRVRMLVTKPDPNTGARRIVCYLKKASDVLFTKIAEGNYTSALTPTLKVGFAGITGLQTQFQEVRNLYSTTADNLIVNTKVGESIKSIKDGDPVNWVVFVDNFAPTAANGAVLKNGLPIGYTVQSINKVGDDPAITNGIQSSAGERHTLSYFPSYGQAMVAYKGVMDQVPDGVRYVVLQAGITPPAGYTDNDPSNDKSADTLSMIRPDLVITQTMSDPALYLGSPRTLTLHVSNDATATNAITSGATVTDTLPAGVLPNNIPTSINGWTVSVQGSVITATRSGGLAVGAAYPDLVLPVRVARDAKPGRVSNKATARPNNQKELALSNSNSSVAYTISAAGFLSGSVDKASIAEDPAAGNAGKVTFKLDKSWTVGANVFWHIAGTATGTEDYTVNPQAQGTMRVTIPAGQTSLTYTFTAKDDGLVEGNETIEVVIDSVILTDNTFIGVTGSPVKITLLDKQFQGQGGTGGSCTELKSPGGQVYYARVEKVQDGKVPGTPVVFRFKLDVASAREVTLHYKLAGTAVKGTHYNDPGNGTLVIAAKQTSKDLTLPVLTNNRIEDNVVQINITDAKTTLTNGSCVQYAVDATTGKSSATITGDKSKLVLSVKGLSDGAEPGTPARLIISLPAGITSGTALKLVYTLGGTAKKGVDYKDPGASLSLPAGQNSDTISIAVIDNKVIEGDRTLTFGLQAGVYKVNSASGSATVKITDDEDDDTPDKRAARQLCIRASNGAEGGANGRFVVGFRDSTLTASKDLRILYNGTGSTAELSKDYEPFATQTGVLVLTAGRSSIATDIVIIDDHLAEITEQIVLNLTAVQSAYTNLNFEIGTGCEKGIIKITDNDAVQLVLSNGGSITEGETGTFTIAINGAVQLGSPLQLRLTYTHNEEHRFTIAGTQLPLTYVRVVSMQPGVNLKEQVQSVENELHDEPGYVQLQAQLGNIGDLKVSFSGDTISTIPVRDNDPLLISWAGVPALSRQEGSSGGYGKMPFHITMNRASSRPVIVRYAIDNAIPGLSPLQRAILKSQVSGLQARFADVDDTGADSHGQYTVGVAAGQVDVTIEIPVLEDSLFEATEQFQLTIEEGRMQLKSGREGNPEPIGSGQIRGILVNDDRFKCEGDYDYDGLPNWKEAGYASLELCEGDTGPQELVDTDGDGIPDYLDDDSDADGAPDAVEAWSKNNRVIDNNGGKIRVHPAVSPNGDGKGNERMYIENINKYPENEVVLFNRWGDLVYKAQGYNNQDVSFEGRSNAGNRKNQDVPDGVYYYVIYLKAKGDIIGRYTGYIVIKR